MDGKSLSLIISMYFYVVHSHCCSRKVGRVVCMYGVCRVVCRVVCRSEVVDRWPIKDPVRSGTAQLLYGSVVWRRQLQLPIEGYR